MACKENTNALLSNSWTFDSLNGKKINRKCLKQTFFRNKYFLRFFLHGLMDDMISKYILTEKRKCELEYSW